jgi:UDP-N-acetyl-D-galactosamine dehydrogenase
VKKLKVAIVGLGYVGLPLAVAMARHLPVIGFDVKRSRIEELRQGHDATGEVEKPALRASTLLVTDAPEAMRGADVFIITVPTPVDDKNLPDLGAVKAACRTVAKVMDKGAVVILESTVYPGVTEEICGPELAEASGLVCGVDFFLGYSPERINPGDREHTVDRITKVIAGQTPEVTEILAAVYGPVTKGGVFRAANIKTAEAAKVIENAQRDINIAFINEVTTIFRKLGISVHDVLEASATKWNFLPFKPGLVGGHCIGVDPFYLAHCAQALGYHPEVILAGRRINDAMGAFLATEIDADLKCEKAKILVLGLTFKENVPDLRNSKVIDVIRTLEKLGHNVAVHDPLADAVEAKEEYGVDILSSLEGIHGLDCLVGAVAHDDYAAFTVETFEELLKPNGLVADIKGMWRHSQLPEGLRRWQI